MKATFIRNVDSWRGDARLYHLSEPLDGAEYVIVSRITDYPPEAEEIRALLGETATVGETFIFPHDGGEGDDPTSWQENSNSSYNDPVEHADLLASLGFDVS